MEACPLPKGTQRARVMLLPPGFQASQMPSFGPVLLEDLILGSYGFYFRFSFNSPSFCYNKKTILCQVGWLNL